jgi:hypothetical protein
MSKRPSAKMPSVPTPTGEDGLADKVAIAVGSTLGRLVNQKNALLAQLSRVEAKIAKASRRAGDRLKASLPDAVPRLTSARKAKRPATRPRTARKTVAPPATHGPDPATRETVRAAKVRSARPRQSATTRSPVAHGARRG